MASGKEYLDFILEQAVVKLGIASKIFNENIIKLQTSI